MSDIIISCYEQSQEWAEKLVTAVASEKVEYVVPSVLKTNLSVKRHAMSAYKTASHVLEQYKALVISDSGHIQTVAESFQKADQML